MNQVNNPRRDAGFSCSRESQPVGSRQSIAEQKIESRLRRLGDRIRDLVEGSHPGWSRDRAWIREALQELVDQHPTLLWSARVAKYTEGAVRILLWMAIEQALSSLEKVADSLGES